jgi:hypothetical protein
MPLIDMITPGRRSPSSPRPHIVQLSFTAAVKRFILFGSQDRNNVVKKEAGKKKLEFGGKSPKIGEIGDFSRTTRREESYC